MRVFLEPWECITIEATELIEAGDTVVVEAVSQSGLGMPASVAAPSSRTSTSGPSVAHDHPLRDLRERDEALAAVGLRA